MLVIRIFIILIIALPLFGSYVSAHVTNEKTIYDDIEFSDAKEQIIYLRGLNIISPPQGANLYKPQEKLTMAELAYWVAAFKKLGGHEAKTEDLQKSAVERGLVDSLEGNATYADINLAYFNGKAMVEKPEEELSKEEFALFMGNFLNEKVDGITLFDMASYEPGPVGIVEKVSFEMEGKGKEAYKVFRFTMNGVEYQVSKHPKIIYGPVDLGEWEGKEIEESWLSSGDGKKKVIEVIKVKMNEFANSQTAKQNEPTLSVETNQMSGGPQPQPARASIAVLVLGGSILVIILGWVLFNRRRFT